MLREVEAGWPSAVSPDVNAEHFTLSDDEIRARYPVLSQALLAGASGQLRNLATTGGNLL